MTTWRFHCLFFIKFWQSLVQTCSTAFCICLRQRIISTVSSFFERATLFKLFYRKRSYLGELWWMMLCELRFMSLHGIFGGCKTKQIKELASEIYFLSYRVSRKRSKGWYFIYTTNKQKQRSFGRGRPRRSFAFCVYKLQIYQGQSLIKNQNVL